MEFEKLESRNNVLCIILYSHVKYNQTAKSTMEYYSEGVIIRYEWLFFSIHS